MDMEEKYKETMQRIQAEIDRDATKPEKTVSAKPPSKAPQRSFLQILRTIFLWFVVLTGMGLAFLCGRWSMYPRFVSIIPPLSRSIRPGASPEEIIREFLKAGQARNDQQVLALCHPEFLTDHRHDVVDFLEDAPEDFADIQEVKMLTREELARVDFTLTERDGNMSSGGIWLKQYQGEWRIFDLTPL